MSAKKQEFEVIDINEIESTPEARKGKTLSLLWFLMYVICIVSICLVILTFLLQRSKVDGTSMTPTLSDGQGVLVNKFSYMVSSPKRYDIIVFRYDNSKSVNYVKRIIGLPGETVQIIGGHVYINGKQLEDDKFGDTVMTYAGIAENPIKLEDGEYFVLGDNRNSSSDSRYADVGIVHKGQIIGKLFIK
ncbi:MAG: signal peptidase I [Lachnospiraceae bacterium]|nr:signal peptidase I [Lachnospiraceae bacterium]MBQ3968603.1 signal peptidase I [Lachnospiraceae bacterium]